MRSSAKLFVLLFPEAYLYPPCPPDPLTVLLILVYFCFLSATKVSALPEELRAPQSAGQHSAHTQPSSTAFPSPAPVVSITGQEAGWRTVRSAGSSCTGVAPGHTLVSVGSVPALPMGPWAQQAILGEPQMPCATRKQGSAPGHSQSNSDAWVPQPLS